jgi:hypothetical protein
MKKLSKMPDGSLNEEFIAELNLGSSATQAELTAEVTRLQTEYDSNGYARKRKEKYDALNQFELISDDSINGTTTHKDAILAIKAEFPKL